MSRFVFLYFLPLSQLNVVWSYFVIFRMFALELRQCWFWNWRAFNLPMRQGKKRGNFKIDINLNTIESFLYCLSSRHLNILFMHNNRFYWLRNIIFLQLINGTKSPIFPSNFFSKQWTFLKICTVYQIDFVKNFNKITNTIGVAHQPVVINDLASSSGADQAKRASILFAFSLLKRN